MINYLSLGTAASATNGILVTGATNATPIVITLNANHRLKNGDRIAIQGITGNTAANGIFTLANVGATTAELAGSVGNGTFGGTAVVALVMDRVPFHARHRAVARVVDGLRNVVPFEGTVIIEGSNQSDAEFQAGPVFVDAVTAVPGQAAIPAAGGATQDGIDEFAEVALFRFMRMRVSAFTAGSVKGGLLT